MTFLKKFLYHFVGVIHKFIVLLLPLAFGVAILLSGPQYIEKALERSKAYDQVIPTVLDSSQKAAKDQESKKLLADPEIKAAAQKSFTPALIQTSTENVLDGLFAWAQGKTKEPEFRIDLTNAKADLASNIAAYAEKRANGLPVCTLQQLRQLSPDIDLLQVPCLPPGTNVSAVSQQYSQKFLSEGDFLKDPVITNKSIAKEGSKPLSEQLSAVPQAYSALQSGKWVLLAIVVILSAALIFARRNRIAGLKHVAWTLVSVATFLLIIITVYWFVFDRANTGRIADNAVQAMWVDGAQSILSDLNRIIVWFSVGYLAIGGGALLFLRFGPHNKKPIKDEVEKEPETETTEEEPEKPHHKTKEI